MKKMKYNAIPKQEKTSSSRIEPQEWNYIINVLKEQANHNSSILEDVPLLRKDLEKLTTEEMEILKANIETLFSDLEEHFQNKNNPHNVKADQVEYVPNENVKEAIDRSAKLDEENFFTERQKFASGIYTPTILMDSDGLIRGLGVGIDDQDAVNKSQLDKKVDKIETPTVDPVIERVYGTKSDGTQTTFQLTNLELQPNTIVKRSESGKILDLELHDADNNAHPDIRTMLQAVRGAFVYRGKANFTTEYLRQYTGELSSIIILEYGRDAVMGDVLVDLDEVEWYFNGDNWFEYGQGQIALATKLNDGLLSKEDYAKIQKMYGNLNWDSDRGSVVDPIAFKLVVLGVGQSINDYIANNQVYINTRYTYLKNDFSSIVGESIGDLIIQSGGIFDGELDAGEFGEAFTVELDAGEFI